MADGKQLPQPPLVLLNPDRVSRIGVVLMKKKFQRLLGDDFKEMRDEVRKTYGLSKEEAQQALLYGLKLARIAINEIVDDLEARFAKQIEEDKE